MSKEKFFTSKKALVTLIAASLTVIFAMGIRQTFGLFFFDFNTDLNISISHFGFVIGFDGFSLSLGSRKQERGDVKQPKNRAPQKSTPGDDFCWGPQKGPLKGLYRQIRDPIFFI